MTREHEWSHGEQNYVIVNRLAPSYDPYEDEETVKEYAKEADYVVENVDQRLEDLNLQRDVEKISIHV